MTPKDLLVSWLNDAYAMEEAVVQILEKQQGQAKGMPDLEQAITTHLAQTKHHAELVKNALNELGSSTSSVKSGLATVMGWMQGMSTGPAGDTLVKDSIADYAVEHFEMASYRSIRAAAEQLGLTNVVGMADEILPQEEWMANFLNTHLAGVTQHAMNSLTTAGSSR